MQKKCYNVPDQPFDDIFYFQFPKLFSYMRIPERTSDDARILGLREPE